MPSFAIDSPNFGTCPEPLLIGAEGRIIGCDAGFAGVAGVDRAGEAGAGACAGCAGPGLDTGAGVGPDEPLFNFPFILLVVY